MTLVYLPLKIQNWIAGISFPVKDKTDLPSFIPSLIHRSMKPLILVVQAEGVQKEY